MSWVNDTIRDFGRALGMDEDLALNEQGMLCLSFETGGDLFFEQVEDEILVYIIKEISRHDENILRRALELCHFHQALPFDVNPGFIEPDRLIFLTRLHETDFSMPILESAIGLLRRLHLGVVDKSDY